MSVHLIARLLVSVAVVLLAGAPLVAAPVAATAASQEPQTLTILLMGLDRREWQAIDEDVRPDALGVLHLDLAAGTCRMLSIPRDSYTAVPGVGMTKINHAYLEGGVELEREAVSAFLGVDIDRYGLIDMAGFRELVDAVGGITIQEPEVFEMSYEEGSYAYASSPQTLTGEEALAYARYRYGPDGDFGRMRRQQQLILSFLQTTAQMDVATLISDVLPALKDHTRTDMSREELVRLAIALRQSCTADTIGLASLDGAAAMAWDDLFQQELWVVLVDPAEVEAKVAWLLGR